MIEEKLTDRDNELINQAYESISRNHKKNRHKVGAALRTSNGKVFHSINIDARIGRVAVCAEPIALANAIMAGENTFDTIVAVRYLGDQTPGPKYEVIPPCGMCREIILDYDENIRVIVEREGQLFKVHMRDLLPVKFSKDD